WAPATPAADYLSVLHKVIETGETVEITLQLSSPEGTPVYHAVSTTAERDAAGRIVGALSISRDITELMQTQQALRDSEERYRQIFDNTQESLFLVEVLEKGRFRILEVNPRFEETIGYGADDLIGKTLEQALPEPIATVLNARYRHCVEDGGIAQEQLELDLGNGVRTFHSTLIPVANGQGVIHRIVGLMRDITERLQSETAMRRLNRTLKTLSSGNAVLVRVTSEAELLEQMCHVVVGVGGYQLAWIGFAREDGTTEAVAAAGEDAQFMDNGIGHLPHRTLAEDPANTAVRTGETQIVRDLDDDPIDPVHRGEHACLGFRSCLALPLKVEDNAPGVLAIYSRDSAAFDGDELQLLTEMAKNLAYGIHALRVRLERENFVQRLQESIEATIQALASTVELRDPYTAGHQHRVAELAKAVAQEMGLSETQIQVVYLAGMVHDIGKIAIPAEILSKPGRLSEAEFTLVRTHAEAGYDILKNIEFPWPIAQIVRQHHERLDGSGYPLGLHKDEILLEARILAVCDVVEAMTTHRPYRPGLGIEAALDAIEKGRLELYDAQVVASCLRVIRDRGFRFQ
ncbi:MAG: PAS domain-containing protein, partial [Candidatus Thiodiazotropha sp.]